MLGILVGPMLFSNRLCAQDDKAASQPPSADTSTPEAGSEPQQQTLELQQPTDVSQDNDAPQDNDLISVIRNVETGLPLRSVISPLRWGHLSLLSLGMLESYDTNYRVQRNATPVELTALQGLVVYSVRRQKSSLDLQYAPQLGFVNDGGNETVAAAHLAGLETARHFGQHWTVGASDTFRYLPPLLPLSGTGFSPDFASGTTSSTAFLTAGQKALINSFSAHLNYLSRSLGRFSVTGTYEFIRLSQGDSAQPAPGNPQPLVAANGTTQRPSMGGGVSWTKELSQKNTVGLQYRYEQQSYLGSTNRFNVFGLSYDRMLKPTLRLGLQAGPAISDSRTSTADTRVITVYGSASVFKSFGNGEAGLMFSRDNTFTGLLSNSFHNRYDLSYRRRLHDRWGIAAGGSYVQQYSTNGHTTSGTLEWGEFDYALSRSWALSTSYHYFNSNGAGQQFGGRQAIAGGIRWSWASETTSK
jgi:hypothetical protein